MVDLPETKGITITECLDKGFFDPVTGVVSDPMSGESMTLGEALDKGIVADTPQIVDPSTDKVMPLSEAINVGLVDPISGTIRDAGSGDHVSLDEAKDKGVVKDENVEQVKTYRPGMSINKAIQDGHFDPATGLFTDPVTGKEYDLAEAITAGLIDPSKRDPSPEKTPPKGVGSPQPVLITETVQVGVAAAVADKHEGVQVRDTVPLMKDVGVHFKTPTGDMVDAATVASDMSGVDEPPKVVPSLEDARRVSSDTTTLCYVPSESPQVSKCTERMSPRPHTHHCDPAPPRSFRNANTVG